MKIGVIHLFRHQMEAEWSEDLNENRLWWGREWEQAAVGVTPLHPQVCVVIESMIILRLQCLLSLFYDPTINIIRILDNVAPLQCHCVPFPLFWQLRCPDWEILGGELFNFKNWVPHCYLKMMRWFSNWGPGTPNGVCLELWNCMKYYMMRP